MQPWHIAWILCALPIVAAHGAYLIAIDAGTASACIPYVDGCISISRAARVGNSLFWFRGLLMPCAGLLALFWWLQKEWLDQLSVSSRHKHHWVLVLGISGALFLLLYANFLGSSGDMYNLMRRFGVTLYFSLTALAQLVSLHTLVGIRHTLTRETGRLILCQLVLVGIQWFMGIVHVFAKFLMPADMQDLFENAIEWHFALYMTLFFGCSARIWQLQKFRWNLTMEKI